MRKMVVLLVLVCAMATFCVEAEAYTAGWYTCTVLQAGVSSNIVFVQLSEPTTNMTGTWYAADPNRAKEILATALTAISTGKKVYTKIVPFQDYYTMGGFFLKD